MHPPRLHTSRLGAAGALALVALAASAAPATAQTVLHTFTGTATNQNFGSSVASAGDVDDDGFPDLIIGAHGDDTLGTNAGAAFVYSGRTGAPLLSWFGDAAGEELGSAVDGAGDVNADDHADLIVGEYRHLGLGLDSGRTYVYSGADGGVLLVLEATGVGDEFGIGVAGIGDIDGDDKSDVAVGAHHDNTNGHHAGSVRVVSGATGGQIHLFVGDEPHDDLGHVLAGIGDINGDDVPDVIGGLHDNPEPGQARVYSGSDGAVLFTFMGSSDGDFFGHAVAGAGDVDGDGVPDLLIGAQSDDTAALDAGRAWLRSGATGAVIFDWVGDAMKDAFGASVSTAGDWDGDGVLDVVVGIPGADANGPGSSAARFLSGADGSVLFTYNGTSPGIRIDTFVAGLGDVNDDDRPDVLIGLPFHDQAATDAGLAVVLSGALPTWEGLGGGLTGAAGIPSLAGQGLLADATPGALLLREAAPLAPALLFVSLTSTPVPFKGGQLGAFPPIAQIALFTNAAGTLVLPWAAWPPGVPAGTLLYFQDAVKDTGAVQGVALTNLLLGTTK